MQCSHQILHHFKRASLASGGKLRFTYMAERLAKFGVGACDATAPPRQVLFGSGEREAIEIEILVDEFCGQRGSRGMDQVPAQIDLPVRERNGSHGGVNAFEKLGLADVRRSERRQARFLKVALPGKMRRERIEFGKSHHVKVSNRIAKVFPLL